MGLPGTAAVRFYGQLGGFPRRRPPQLTYSALPGLVSAAMLEMSGVSGVSGVNFKLLNQKSEKVRERESSKK